MTQTKLKDLRILAGRTEANITALRLSVEGLDPKHNDLCDRVVRLQSLMAEIRHAIEKLEV